MPCRWERASTIMNHSRLRMYAIRRLPELKSIAAMEKAAAEAKVTMANAEAKLKAAEVAAQQAAAAKSIGRS